MPLPSAPAPSNATLYSRSGWVTGNGRKSRASIKRNADVQAPMPSPKDRIAAAEVIFRFISCRHPKTASARSESSHGSSRMSRLSSRRRNTEPKARRASAGSRPCSIASAMWDWSSSSISRLKPSPRTTFRMRDHNDISHRPQHPSYRGSDRLPARFFGAELFLASRRQLVNAGPPSCVSGDPLGANPAGFLHPVQRRIERTFLGAEHIAGPILDGGHNGIAVEFGAPRENLQNQQIERALERIGFWHTQTS